MWHENKHEKITCECGTIVAACQLDRHRRSRWHAKAAKAFELEKRGLSCAEIGRQLGESKAYVRVRLRWGRA